MNKFTKLILTSAVFATSGFATEEIVPTTIEVGATLNVSGSVITNTDMSVKGTLHVKGGSIVNNGIMTYGENSSLVIENPDSSPAGTFTQDSTPLAELKTDTYANCFPTDGVVDLSNATSAAETTFKGGEITGGTVKLKHGTGTFTALSLSSDSTRPIVGVYEYDAAEAIKLETTVTTVEAEKYIKRQLTADAEGQFKKEFSNADAIKLSADSINFPGRTDVLGADGPTTGLYLFKAAGTQPTDQRKTFPKLLADTTILNTSGNKLKTEDIAYEVYAEGTNPENYGKSAIIGLKTNDNSTLAVATTVGSTPTINIGFEGSGDLTFAGYGTAADTTTINYGSELAVSSLTFSGDNSGYTGTASFGTEVKKVVANGDNTLPKRLGEIKGELENKTGTNTIDNAAGTKVNSLTITAGTLTVSTGSTLTIG